MHTLTPTSTTPFDRQIWQSHQSCLGYEFHDDQFQTVSSDEATSNFSTDKQVRAALGCFGPPPVPYILLISTTVYIYNIY